MSSTPGPELGPTKIVIASDKFKGSLEAADVAAHLADGLLSVDPALVVERISVADGGEGTVSAAVDAGYRPVSVVVTGPLGEPVHATMAVQDHVAVIEMAAASGLGALPRDEQGLPRIDPLGASSTGTGELIKAALDAGCRTVVLGVGGSAGTDGGAGLLTALGARLLTEDGDPVPPGGGGLRALDRVVLGDLDPRLADTQFVLAADVTNPLLGPHGAAAVFGPQKGASPEQVEVLDAALTRYALRVATALGEEPERHTGAEGAGAAGGVGYAVLAVLGAEKRPGIDVVLDLVGLDERLTGAQLVITGEGSLDGQSLGGKTPIGVARRAREHQVPTVFAVCGRTLLRPDQVAEAGFDAVFALSDLEPDPARSMAEAGRLLEQVGAHIARHLRSPSGTEARR